MSESIADIVASAELLTVESAAQAAVIDERRRRLEQTISELSDRIKAGETTGGVINDFVIVHHRMLPSFHPEIMTIYRELDARLKSHPGEFILLVERSEEDLYHSIVQDDSIPKHVTEKLTLGLLAEPSGLRFDLSGTVFFRTSRYTADGKVISEGQLTTSRGNENIPMMLNQGILDSSHLAWTGSRRREYRATARPQACLGRGVAHHPERVVRAVEH